MRSKKRFSFTWLSRMLFLLPSAAGVAVFVLIPFADVAKRSFHSSLSGDFSKADNYLAVWNNRAFKLAVGNTISFVGVCLPILLFVSLLLALVMWRFSFLWPCRMLYLLPMAVPTASIVLAWRLIFAREGFLNGVLGTDIDFLEGESAFWVLVFTYIWRNLGYTLVLWLAALKCVPAELVEAARVDGAGKARCFFKVVLPQIMGSAYTITVLSLLNTFKMFREAYLIGGSYPAESIYLLQHVFNNWYTGLDFDKMAAGAMMTALALGTVAACLNRMMTEGGFHK